MQCGTGKVGECWVWVKWDMGRLHGLPANPGWGRGPCPLTLALSEDREEVGGGGPQLGAAEEAHQGGHQAGTRLRVAAQLANQVLRGVRRHRVGRSLAWAWMDGVAEFLEMQLGAATSGNTSNQSAC